MMCEENKEMCVLGHFRYHIYEVKLEGSDDETEYKVTCIERTCRTMKDPLDEDSDMQIYPFDDLRSARTAFENAVQYCLNRTSFTNVSIFQQQTAGL